MNKLWTREGGSSMSDGLITAVPHGFRAAGVTAGLKKSGSLDMAVLAADGPCAAAGVYTTNRVCAAPVKWCRALTPSSAIRAVVVNSGNANAATGAQGLADAQRTAETAARLLGCRPDQVLVASTGVIGRPLPMNRIEAGTAQAMAALVPEAAAFATAARAIMTTDTRPKIVNRTFTSGGRETAILGLAKGAAMIGPRMATMLGFLLTDASVAADDLRAILSRAVDRSFNCLSVEGHASTNDTVLLLASGQGPALAGQALAEFAAMVESACETLAQAIADDGEGSTHFITIEVDGCATEADARSIARCVADSPLVKTAIHGADPNWGRIVSAAGYAGVMFEEQDLSLTINGVVVYDRGAPTAFDPEALSRSIRARRPVELRLAFTLGPAAVRFWTCDLTAEYIRLNADYTT